MADGQTEKAVKLYERSVAAKRDPGTLAVLAALQGKTDYAISLYRERSAPEPDKPEIRSDLARCSRRKRSAIRKRSPNMKRHCASIRSIRKLMNFGAVLSRLRPQRRSRHAVRAGGEGTSEFPSRTCTWRWSTRECIARCGIAGGHCRRSDHPPRRTRVQQRAAMPPSERIYAVGSRI